MTQFSIQWILSLNRLCQKWGQVHLVSNAIESNNGRLGCSPKHSLQDIGAVRCYEHLTEVRDILSQQFADAKRLGRMQKRFGFVDEQDVPIGAKNRGHYPRERSKAVSLVI
jgi:hypothetical protein